MSSNDVDMPDPVEVAQPEHEPLMEAVEESPDTDMDGGCFKIIFATVVFSQCEVQGTTC